MTAGDSDTEDEDDDDDEDEDQTESMDLTVSSVASSSSSQEKEALQGLLSLKSAPQRPSTSLSPQRQACFIEEGRI